MRTAHRHANCAPPRTPRAARGWLPTLLAAATLLAPLAACASSRTAAPPPAENDAADWARWFARIAELDREVTELGEHYRREVRDLDDEARIQRRLAHLVARDQAVRDAIIEVLGEGDPRNPSEAYKHALNELSRLGIAIDEENVGELKEMLAAREWFKISEFGEQADRDAWLLVQHADRDLALQKEVLARLTRLVELDETQPSNVAYLHDRVAVAEGRKQRFGTQGQCTESGSWEAFETEAPADLDELRARFGLPTMAEYAARAGAQCP